MTESRLTGGTAVVVHGLWGHPEDWYLVAAELRQAGVRVVAPDLPSHRSTTAGLAEDALEVRDAIRRAEPPVVAAGWSYGSDVLSVAAADETSLARLIYLANLPKPVGYDEDVSLLEAEPYIVVGVDGRFVLDNDWWLNESDGNTFPSDVKRHLRDYPRRWVTRGTFDPITAAAWLTIPFTVVFGEHDPLISDADKHGAPTKFDDVRVLDTDHFVILRQPHVVADVIKEGLASDT